GLVDVHTYMAVAAGAEPVRIDVTFALPAVWNGDGHMRLHCGEGFDVPGGRFPNRMKRDLVSLHCDPAIRERFIAALSETPRYRELAASGHRDPQPATSTGRPARRHSGRPSSRRRARMPAWRSTSIAWGASTQKGPRQ